jgi:hypothetical protein
MEPIEQKSYIHVSVLSGAVFGVITSLVLYGLLLVAVGSGAPGFGGLIFGCLLCCGLYIAPGLLASRLYIYEIKSAIEVGKGALIGLVAGVSFGVILGFMDVVWLLFGVDTNALFVDYYIQILQSFDTPEVQDAIDQMREAQEKGGAGVGSILITLLVAGIVNLLSGMAGAAIFSKSFEKNDF